MERPKTTGEAEVTAAKVEEKKVFNRTRADEYKDIDQRSVIPQKDVIWANPGALGLAGFGFNTILLQIHNIGWIPNTMPLVWGFFWGGMAQVIAGIIDARRGDTFGLTAFTSFGAFWIGLSSAFLLEWLGIITLDGPSLAWTMIGWCVFTGYMTIGTFRISRAHVFIFASLTLLFGLLAGHFFGVIPAYVAGVEGIFCGAAAVYGSAAVIMNAQYGRWVLPIGLLPKKLQLPRVSPIKPEAASLSEVVRAQLEELIRTKLEEPLALDRSGKAMLEVLAKARDDSNFLARLAENHAEVLKGYDLTSEEKAALASGDIRWIESKLGTLAEPLKSWLNARLAQEKW